MQALHAGPNLRSILMRSANDRDILEFPMFIFNSRLAASGAGDLLDFFIFKSNHNILAMTGGANPMDFAP